MIDTNQLSALVSAFRVETEKESISPETVGILLQDILDFADTFLEIDPDEPSAMPNPFEHCRGAAENGGEHFSLTQRSHAQVIERLRSSVVAALQGNALNVPSLRDIVDYMRKHDALFPEFRQSATYKLFEPPIFENKKKNCGYFF